MSDIADILQRGSEWADRLAEENKQRARKFKSLQEYADVTGIAGKDQTTPMGLDQLEGMVEGNLFKQGMQRMQSTIDAQRAATLETLQRLGAARGLQNFAGDLPGMMQQPAPSNAQLGDYYENPENYGGAPMGSPDLNAAILQSLARNPQAAASPQLDNLLGVLQRYSGAGAALPAAQLAHIQAQTEALRNENNPTVIPPVGGQLEGGYRWAGFPGTKLRSTYPDMTLGPQQFLPGAAGEPAVYVGPRGQLFQPREANVAQQQTADLNTLVKSGESIKEIDRQINTWKYAEQQNKENPKDNPAPDPEQLKELQMMRRIHKAVMERGAAGLIPATPAAAAPAGPRVGRITTIQPPVGTVQIYRGERYRYNGKYGPDDKRAWEKMPGERPAAGD